MTRSSRICAPWRRRNPESIDAPSRACSRRPSKKKAAQRAQEMRARRLAERQDPRPLIEVPRFDAPWLPQIGTINELLGSSTAPEPPERDIDGAASRARKLALPGLHLFTRADEDKPPAGLPAPEQWVLQRMGEMEVAEMIERHIDYVDENGCSVHL